MLDLSVPHKVEPHLCTHWRGKHWITLYPMESYSACLIAISNRGLNKKFKMVAPFGAISSNGLLFWPDTDGWPAWMKVGVDYLCSDGDILSGEEERVQRLEFSPEQIGIQQDGWGIYVEYMDIVAGRLITFKPNGHIELNRFVGECIPIVRECGTHKIFAQKYDKQKGVVK